jgi:hypothetical protein
MGIGAGIRKVMLGALAASSLFAAGRIFDAQVVTGTLGQPSATTTIKGNQIPTSPIPFGGVIKENATASTPWWPPRVVPPKGAPNVLLIMTDDQGYGVPGTLEGPNLKRTLET